MLRSMSEAASPSPPLPDTLPAVRLQPGREKRVLSGYPWVFSNEIRMEPGLREVPLGGLVRLESSNGRPIAIAGFNRHALIAARVLARDPAATIDSGFLAARLQAAAELRARLFERPFYRAVHAEADGLPGLVVDRYGEVLVVQSNTALMDRLETPLLDALEEVFAPAAIVLRNDSPARTLEGLETGVRLARGTLSGPVELEENGARFLADPLGGQKTGWFYDQRANRDRLAPYVRGARVLDLFSYVGAWGIRAAGFGASQVTCVDSSARAVEATSNNAALNGMAEKVEAVRADAFEFLKQARAERRRWDVVIVDPPAFIKRRKDFKEGSVAYRRINEMAMQVLERDGLLVSCSCSQHMQRDTLLDAINAGARHLDRQAQVLERLQQGPDHPVQAAISESDYLKGFICRILPS